MVKSQTRGSSEQDKSCSTFVPTPFSLVIYDDSPTLWLCQKPWRSPRQHCPWRTSLAKPPNPVTTSSDELALSRSIFPSRPQWNWSLHSFCHDLTTAVLSFLTGLLPLSTAFVAYRSVLLASYRKKRKTDQIIPLLQSLQWHPIQQRIQYKINTLCYKCTYHEHCSVLALWLSI